MSFDALQERLTALQETTAQVKELIGRLANLKFEPGSVPLSDADDDDDNVAAELSSEINQILREEEEDLELLGEEVTDLRGGKEGSDAARRKERLREGVARLEGEVKSCRITFHKAQLAARRSLSAARQLERQILLRSYARTSSTPSRSGANSPAPSLGAPRRRHTQKARGGGGEDDNDPVVGASSDLTRSLHRARQLVQDELARSMTLHESLAESTAQLKTLGSSYGRMEDMLASSRDLLGTLMKSTKSDTWYLQTTFYMLVATLAWLVFRRWMYGPLWWLVWLPLRLVFKTGSTAVGMTAGGGGRGGARMEVVGESGRSVEVEMGQEGTVPTAKVGTEKEKTESDIDSMVERIGRMVDGMPEGDGMPKDEAEEVDAGPVVDTEVFVPSESGQAVAQEDGRARDEL